MCEIDWKLVANSEELITAMGDEPCFHDGTVLGSTQEGDVIEVSIHIFRGTPEVDAQGYYKLEKHHLVTLRMSGIHESSLPEHYGGDILGELEVRADGQLIRMEFGSIMSSGGHVLCKAVDVAKVVPCDPEGHAFP
jgi:hypothetical protein